MDELRMVTRQDIEECFLKDQHRISDLETVKPIFRDQNIKTDVNTGYSSLNELLDRFRPGELIVIHMQPSVVKTAFIMGITHTALKNGKTVAFFSLELCRRQVIAWMLCSGSRAAIQKCMESPSDDFSKRLTNSMNSLCNASLYIDDSAAITPTQLRSKCHHLKKEQGLSDDVFYHYDTPLTVEHETDILLQAGFRDVRVMERWGESTYTVLACKT